MAWPENGTDISILVSSKNFGVAQVYFGRRPEFVGIEAGKANARLIAAAPDLLEALKQMIEAYETVTSVGSQTFTRHFDGATVGPAYKAIAKAEGR